MSDAPISIVTGATRGIGRSVVAALVEAGRRVLAVGRDADAMARLVGEHGERVRPLILELRDADAVERVSEAAAELGGPREPVCCAGVVRYQRVGAITPADLREQLAVNLEVPLLLGQALGAQMADLQGGAMVFVSSTLAARPAPATTAYAASKAGLEAAARGLALELASTGVRVNVVAPGVVDTDMVRGARDDGMDADVRLRALRDLHPLGSLGSAAQVAEAILFLLESEWTTGTTLRVDGGLLLA